MGDVLPFTGRFFAVRDWTSAERAQIQVLAKQLKAQAVGVEIVYGASDAGDPWCVIKDGQENVLMHVARIGGAVVIHDMIADLIREGRDLWFALGRMLGDEDAASNEPGVVDHELDHRNAQFLLAIVVGAAFGLDPASVFDPQAALEGLDFPDGLAEALRPAVAPSDPAAPAPQDRADRDPAAPASPERAAVQPHTGDARAQAEPMEGHAANVGDGADQAPEVEIQGDEPDEAAVGGPMVAGTAGADTLEGTPAAEVIRGGPGDDVLSGGGAPTGQVDLLDGGSGDDEISVDGSVVAEGGSGADTFVVAPPSRTGDATTNLGVIVDFDEAAGDVLRFDTIHKVTITSITPVDNVLADAAGASTLTSVRPVAGDRIGVDLNGDGVEDGFVLVAATDGKVALGRGEKDPVFGDLYPDHVYFDGQILTIGSSIWIDADSF
jgi:hypothetical protein